MRITCISALVISICTAITPSNPLAHHPTIIALEGVSGAGKSTLSMLLSTQLQEVCAIPEPYLQWHDINGTGNLFELFLQEKQRWTLTFLQHVAITHYEALKTACDRYPEKAVFITDRSYLSSLNVFGPLLLAQHALTPLEWELYQHTVHMLATHTELQPQGFIYLRTHPTTAHARAYRRNPKSCGPLSYFEALHEYHEQWLIHNTSRIPVLILDGEVDFQHDSEIQQKFIEQVKEFVGDIICTTKRYRV